MASHRKYFKQLRISQLRAVIEVARCGGFAPAAAVLEISTPSVWQQIRALETHLKIALVEVIGQRVTLTENGKLLVDLATPVVNGFDAIPDRLLSASAAVPKRLTIASPANILVNELPSPVKTYREKYPEVELSLVDLASNPARKLLESGDVDLAVVGQLGTQFPNTISADLVTEFPFMLVCPTGHPALDIKRITAKGLSKFPLIMSGTGTNTRTRTEEVFQKAGLLDSLRVACETSTKDLLLKYVQLGLGIAIAPISPRYRRNAYGDIAGLEFRDVSTLFGQEQIVILRRHHRSEPDHQQKFRDLVLQSIDQ